MRLRLRASLGIPFPSVRFMSISGGSEDISKFLLSPEQSRRESLGERAIEFQIPLSTKSKKIKGRNHATYKNQIE